MSLYTLQALLNALVVLLFLLEVAELILQFNDSVAAIVFLLQALA
jgi:hypothetical protein